VPDRTKNRAGRFCPPDYRYPASDLARQADLRAETLYVVGGLYGNRWALDTVEALVAAEQGSTTVAFNGDFHWFDAVPDRFAEVNQRVVQQCALRGNVETELGRPLDAGAGCGCAYPEAVDDGTVERSNRILDRLQACVDALLGAREQLRMLPMTLVTAIGPMRIGIVHGDAEALAGWRFAHDALDGPVAHEWLDAVRAASGIDVYASSHTCLPALRDFQLQAGRLTVINNGASGMPNFRGTTHGVLTRISVHPSPHTALYGMERDGVFIDALPVPYDQRRWRREFVRTWPPGSPAYESYFRRIVDCPQFLPGQAYLGAAAGTSQRYPASYIG
jgi:hypothetical protein